MRSLSLVLFILGALISGPSTPAIAAGLISLKELSTPSPLLQLTATRCVRLLRRGNAETLVNTCGSCKIVGITRKRTGVAIPIRRSFNIQGGTSLSMPFRGPGNSRVTSTQNCQSKAADVRDHDKAKTAANSCVVLKQATSGKVVLVNSCGSCRGVAIQRMDRNGTVLSRQAFKIKPNDAATVVPQGAAKVGLIAEFSCPG